MDKLMAMNAEMTMGTREISELIGCNHSDIKRSADRLVSAGAINGGQPLADTPYIHNQNQQTYYEYRLGRIDSITLVAQNCPQFTAALVKRWDELERGIAQPSFMKNLSPEALIMLNDLNNQLELAKPKVEFVDKFVDSSGLFGFRQVAKTLGVKENWLREFLQEQKIMYYLKGKLTAYANHIEAGRFQSRVGVADNGHNFNECKFTAKGVEWIAALIAIEKVKAQ